MKLSRAPWSLTLRSPIMLFFKSFFCWPAFNSIAALGSIGEAQSSFGKIWHDGRAEVAAYSLEIVRYQERRKGNAISIFVTEPFSKNRRLKIDDTRQAKLSDKVEVLKLNLVRDFPTGIYDYNTMLSVFVANENASQVSTGTPLKVSYSSQEWCGHVYQQLIPRGSFIESSTHSYFEGEGDERTQLASPSDAVLSDTLFHWARGLSGPKLAPGAEITRPLLNSLSHMRLSHKPPAFANAIFRVSNDTVQIKAAGRDWETRLHSVVSESGQTHRFWVENEQPKRIIRWEFTGAEGADEKAELVGVERLAYWNQSGKGFEKLLGKIGLRPRQPLSP